MAALVGASRRARRTSRACFHRPGENYGPYTHHANAWVALLNAAGGQEEYKPSRVREYAALRRHHFSTAAILTLQAPDWRYNPTCGFTTRGGRSCHRLAVLRPPARTALASGSTRAPSPGVPYVDLRGDAGDLYLFNSEYVHITPKIRARASGHRGLLATLGAPRGLELRRTRRTCRNLVQPWDGDPHL